MKDKFVKYPAVWGLALKISLWTVVGWVVVGVLAMFIKWTHWAHEGSWLQYLPGLIIAAVIVLCGLALVIAGILQAIFGKKEEEGRDD